MVSRWVRRSALLVAGGGMALTASVSSAATAPRQGVVFGAETAQFEVVTIEVTRARNRVARLVFGWQADCTPGPAATPATSNFAAYVEYRGGYPINKRGAWKKTFDFHPVEDGVHQHFTYSFAGRRSGRNMVGTLKVTLDETDSAGQSIRTCASPAIKYKATEKATFGGLTVGARQPVLVKLNLARTRIQRIRWDWEGTCALGAAATPDTLVERFQQDFVEGPIVIKPNGNFGKSFSYEPRRDTVTGLTYKFRARVVGRRVGSTIKGTVTAGFLETDTATGERVRDCASRPVKFTTKD